MKKLFLILAAATATYTSYAGGISTNTNQSIQFLRSLARGTTLEADAVYSNPAGTAFMQDGFYLSIGNQFAHQERISDTSFAPFAYNGGKTEKHYVGVANSPLVPNLDFVWKRNRLALMASFAIGGGGGTCKYEDGLGSFESAVAVLPAMITGMGYQTTAYSVNSTMQGRYETYAGQIGASYQITKWLSAAAQLRLTYIHNHYLGGISNIQVNPVIPSINPNGNMVSAYQLITMLAQVKPELAAYAPMVADRELDCHQRAFGVSPTLALYASLPAGFAVAAKYEFRTAIRLENQTEEGKSAGLADYADGVKSRGDIPALLTVAASKEFGKLVKLTAEYHYYFDKQTNLAGDKQNFIDGGTQEYLLGVDVKPLKWLTVGCGAQRTMYDLQDGYFSDTSAIMSSYSVGGGVALQFCKLFRINASYMHTFYGTRTVATADATTKLPITNRYTRTTGVWGVGVDFMFGGKR